MRALALAVLVLGTAGCEHYECAIDTDCTDVGTYCALDTHTCVSAGVDAGRDAGPTDAGPRDGGAGEGGLDAGMDAGMDAGDDAGDDASLDDAGDDAATAD